MKTAKRILVVLATVALLVGALAVSAFAVDTPTWTASAQGYTNGQNLNDQKITLVDGVVSMVGNKGTGSTNPAYYNSGTAYRLYGGNTLTFTPESGYKITSIKITTATGSSYLIKSTNSNVTNGTASGLGSATVIITPTDGTQNVVLKNTASSGHYRIQTVTVSYESVGELTPSQQVEQVEKNLTFLEKVAESGTIDTVIFYKDDVVINWVSDSNNVIFDHGEETVTFVVPGAGEEDEVVNVTAYISAEGIEPIEKKFQVTLVAPKTIAGIIAASNGTYTTTGTVMGVNDQSFILADDTGAILVYLQKTPSVSVGDVVSVSGTTSVYNKGKQFGTGTTYTKIGTVEVEYPAPAVLTAADCEAKLSASSINAEYVTITGTLSVSGNYYNIVVDGTTKAQGSFTYPLAADKTALAALNGKQIEITGYLTSIASNKYLNVLVTEYAEVVEEKNISIDGVSLNIADNIDVYYYVSLDEGFKSASASFTFNGVTTTVAEYETLDDGRLMFIFEGINPAQLGDAIDVVISAEYENGTFTATNEGMSVKKYYEMAQAFEGTKNNTALMTLLSDLLVYGAKAQTFIGDPDALVTEGLTLTPSQEDAAIPESNYAVTGDVFKSVALELGSDITVVIKVALEGGNVVTVNFNGTNTTYAQEDLTADENGYYTIKFEGIYATDYAEVITAEVNGNTLTYSVNSYINEKANDENANLAALVKALNNYGASAVAYKNA